MVTMEAEKEQQKQHLQSRTGGDANEEVDEFGDYLGGSSESLLSLVQPEMKMLSKHWLVALKDYALLSLPPGKIHSFIHSVYLYSTSSSPLLLRGALDTARILCRS